MYCAARRVAIEKIIIQSLGNKSCRILAVFCVKSVLYINIHTGNHFMHRQKRYEFQITWPCRNITTNPIKIVIWEVSFSEKHIQTHTSP